jgi:quercetin dioxygenase-like cupin family protein
MRKLSIFFGIIFLAFLSISAFKGLKSSVYEWEKLSVKKIPTGDYRSFFSHSTRSLDELNITAVTLKPGTESNKYQIDGGFEELIIIKDGSVNIEVNGEKRSLGEGSVIVVPSGDEVIITNPLTSNAVYYLIGFKTYDKGTRATDAKNSSPIFIDWKNVEFKPSANGGRRNIMQQKTTNLKELEIHVTTLKEGLPSHNAHTHPDEEIILVRKGFVEETIKDKPYLLGPGSIIFLTNDDMHGIHNAGKGECEYYAIRWLTE